MHLEPSSDKSVSACAPGASCSSSATTLSRADMAAGASPPSWGKHFAAAEYLRLSRIENVAACCAASSYTAADSVTF